MTSNTKKKINKRVIKLCDLLEIDHVGLVTEGTRRLMDQFNKVNGRKSNKIDCAECPFGDNECGWARCPTKDELEAIIYYYKEKIKRALEPYKDKIGVPLEIIIKLGEK